MDTIKFRHNSILRHNPILYGLFQQNESEWRLRRWLIQLQQHIDNELRVSLASYASYAMVMLSMIIQTSSKKAFEHLGLCTEKLTVGILYNVLRVYLSDILTLSFMQLVFTIKWTVSSAIRRIRKRPQSNIGLEVSNKFTLYVKFYLTHWVDTAWNRPLIQLAVQTVYKPNKDGIWYEWALFRIR